MKVIRTWLLRWQRFRNRKHQSRWDVHGRDVLSEMIEHDRIRRQRWLP